MRKEINPVFHPICFQVPKWIKPSGWIQHTPFAMYLVDILRPSKIVELGTFAGVSYCAFCQAVSRLRIETKCYAVDTWEGDPHAGNYGPEIYISLKEYHDPIYGRFSMLLKKDFATALHDFDDESVDLLHIDGFHSFEAASNDFFSWLPKMSETSIVLFHDISVKQDDFGVWKLWASLKEDYPSFEFSHGSGLGVLVTGRSVTSEILEIVNLKGFWKSAYITFFLILGKLMDLFLMIEQKRNR